MFYFSRLITKCYVLDGFRGGKPLEILPDPGYVVGSPRTALVRIADNDGFELQALAPATPTATK